MCSCESRLTKPTPMRNTAAQPCTTTNGNTAAKEFFTRFSLASPLKPVTRSGYRVMLPPVLTCWRSSSSMDRITDKQELLKLIQTEIDLGFTYLDTYKLSGSAEHASRALQNAKTAWTTATGFLDRLTEEEASSFQPCL